MKRGWLLVGMGTVTAFLALSNGCGGAMEPESVSDVGGGSGVGTGGAAGHSAGGTGSRGGNGGHAGQGGGGAGRTAGSNGPNGGAKPQGGSAGHAAGTAGSPSGSAGKNGSAGNAVPKDGGAGPKDGGAGKGGGAAGGGAGWQPVDGSSVGSGGSLAGEAGRGGSDSGIADAQTIPGDGPLGYDEFMDVLFGTWLIGWAGDANHFSWLRFEGDSQNFTGVVRFLAGDDLRVNHPYWNCSGEGTWMVTERANTVLIRLPCADAGTRVYTFDHFSAPSASYMRGSILQASLTPESTTEITHLEGYKFPDTQCNTTLTSCTDPL